MFDKIGQFFSRLNYSHVFNLYTLSNLEAIQRDTLKVLFDARMKAISDFRSAHMNIIAGLIALLGFIGKEEIMKNPDAYTYFMYFIVGSIIYLVIGYNADIIGFYNQTLVLQNNFSLTQKATIKIKKLEFNKKGLEEIIEQEKKLNIKARTIINQFIALFGLGIWICFILGVYFFLSK